MEERIFWGSIVGVTFYMIIPWVLSRVYGFGVFHKGGNRNHIAFTFDDGPNPKYTPQLLDLLKKYNVKATFFVLGSLAEKYPDIIRRMHDEGHLIGIHNYTHKTNWFLTPWVVRSDHIERSAAIVEKITGSRPIYYRPPWGIINFFDFYLRKKFHIVLWSVMISDWRGKRPGHETVMRDRLLRKIKPGSVVLLHDSGDTFAANREAPVYMLKALHEVLATIDSKGLACVRIDEMIEADRAEGRVPVSLPKRLIVALWLKWERLFAKLLSIRKVDENNPMVQFRIRRYSGGRSIRLDDGEEIRKGDKIVELHLNNEFMYELGRRCRTPVQLTVHMIRYMEQGLPQIVRILNNPEYGDVKGIYAISLIHRGTRKFGFTIIDMPRNGFTMMTQLYLRLLLYVIHPQGKERLKTKTELLVPKIIAISRQELQNRYIA